jgi:hypothetical protein
MDLAWLIDATQAGEWHWNSEDGVWYGQKTPPRLTIPAQTFNWSLNNPRFILDGQTLMDYHADPVDVPEYQIGELYEAIIASQID